MSQQFKSSFLRLTSTFCSSFISSEFDFQRQSRCLPGVPQKQAFSYSMGLYIRVVTHFLRKRWDVDSTIIPSRMLSAYMWFSIT